MTKKNSLKTSAKPLVLRELTAEESAKANGGRHHHHKVYGLFPNNGGNGPIYGLMVHP
jgi:hypothetical protein